MSNIKHGRRGLRGFVLLFVVAFISNLSSQAQASPEATSQGVVQQALPDQEIRKVSGDVSLLGGVAEVGAPANQTTFATEDALVAVLESGQQSARFTLPSEGEVQKDGTVRFNRGDGLSLELAKPWAKDANGKSLDTWYVTDGKRLVQHVDTEGAAYPIAADPRLTYGKGAYLNMTGAEIKTVSSAVLAGGGAAAVATCSGLSKLPSAVSKLAKVACTAVGAPTLKGIYSSIVKVWKSGKVSTGSCYQTRIVGPSTGWSKVGMKNCTG